MAIHVVCLDGTGQQYKQPSPTNVALLFDALGGAAQDAGSGSFESEAGVVHGKYLPGVGALGAPALRVLGNLFGDGIAEPIIRGYTFLSRNYTAGDRIVILGFSRGAAAARALAGIVVARGLLAQSYDTGNKDLAYRRAVAAWYDYRKSDHTLANQARLPLIAQLMGGLPPLTGDDFTGPADIAAIGVFDTVSSLGVPHLDAGGNAVFDFSICNTTLHDRVARGFHALAADELRDLYAPTFWAPRAGIIQQVFAGAHADIGGGYPQAGLSNCALAWMAAGLDGAVPGLFDLSRLPAPDPLAPAHDESVSFPFRATPLRARLFPPIAEPSESLRARIDQPVEVLPGYGASLYRPKAHYADGTALLPSPPG